MANGEVCSAEGARLVETPKEKQSLYEDLSQGCLWNLLSREESSAKSL